MITNGPGKLRLEIHAPSRVAQGAVFEIQGRVQGIIPERAHVDFRFENGPALEQDYEIQHADGSTEGILTARLEAGRVQRHFRFQVRANDAVSAWQSVAVLPPPQLVPFAGRPSPQVWLHFPVYIGLPAIDLPDGTSTIEAAAGTQIRLARCRRSAAGPCLARVPLGIGAGSDCCRSSHALGTGQPTGVFVLAGARQKSWKQISARLEAGGTVLSLDFIARVSGTFALHLEDEMGLGNTRLVELRTLDDPAPLVHLERPSRSHDSLDVLPDAEITLQVLVEDPRYAIRSVYLAYRLVRKRDPGPPGATGRLPLYDDVAVGEDAAASACGADRFTFCPAVAQSALAPAAA